MIKYRYLPFTHGKPRYEPVKSNKWQLEAQSLLATGSAAEVAATAESVAVKETKTAPAPPQILLDIV